MISENDPNTVYDESKLHLTVAGYKLWDAMKNWQWTIVLQKVRSQIILLQSSAIIDYSFRQRRPNHALRR